jgi:hypothetical protein
MAKGSIVFMSCHAAQGSRAIKAIVKVTGFFVNGNAIIFAGVKAALFSNKLVPSIVATIAFLPRVA